MARKLERKKSLPAMTAPKSKSSRASKLAIPQKRRQREPEASCNGVKGGNVKKVRFENELTEKQKRISQIIAHFNLSVNELFQLKEYKSLVYWNPKDFSDAFSTSQVPEIYKYFTRESKYQITWDLGEDEENLSSLPLRMQKKALQERQKKLEERFPFKNEVVQRSKELEVELLSDIPISTSVSKSRSKTSPLASGGKAKIKQKLEGKDDLESDSLEMSEEEEGEEELENGIKYNIKNVSYSINPQIVTNPFHIPSWVPDTNNLKISSQDDKKIIDFQPKRLKIIKTGSKSVIVPDINEKIQNFLQNHYKVPIIDDSNTNDYNYSPEEYRKVMSQQQHLLREIHHKITVDRSLELNGDKIERRKLVLPHSSNSKLASDPFRSHGVVIPRPQAASYTSTYYDHFLSQGMAFSRLHQQVRKQHQLKARKVAQIVEQYFKKKKGEKDRLAKEQEQNLKRLSRMAVQAVKKRWLQANKVYRYLQMEKEEELKKIKGREHLSQMLEHSTQLLEAQFSKSSRETTDIASDIGSEPSASDNNFSSNSSDEDSSEDEKERKNGVVSEQKDDSKLSIEELRAKYASILSVNSDGTHSGSDSMDEEGINNGGLASLYSNNKIDITSKKIDQALEYTAEEKAIIDKYNASDENSILNSDSSSSVNSDSEMDTDESSESESEALSGSEVSEQPKASPDAPKKSGLAALLLNNSIQDSSDDQSASDIASLSSDENMSFTDEEDEPKTPKSTHSIESEKEVDTDTFEEEINGSKVKDVPLPSLLRGTLRPYQKQGLNWLASLYNNDTNGILADEMGLGKTIQTISLLAYLACEHHIWGPHLIIVPTSVMLNWEMEFKKFAPGFKVLTYYGSPQQRAQKRKGWNKPDTFHVCITSYQLVVHDQQSFKRRKWRYMILDEAHNIKNFRSTRWRALLNFNTENRLLLTGTPLQNNLIELWSLLYFLMPSSKVNQSMPDGFANLEDFQIWFGKPVDKILEQTTSGGNAELTDLNDNATTRMDEETRNTVSRLHQVLRPYILRRLKKDVETQMPGKYEHVIYCRLSKRQRFLYDDFMSRAQTKETLASGNFLSIINCLMQLRKVCNHPDLFEVRPILTSFAVPKCIASTLELIETLVKKYLQHGTPMSEVSLHNLNMDIVNLDQLDYFSSQSIQELQSSKNIEQQITELNALIDTSKDRETINEVNDYLDYYKHVKVRRKIDVKEKLEQYLYLNKLRCNRRPLLGNSCLKFIETATQPRQVITDTYRDIVLPIPERMARMEDVIEKYSVITPAVVALDMKDQLIPVSTQYKIMEKVTENKIDNPFHKSQVKLSIAFPDKSLLQYDCGKLQKLASLLQDLTSGGHRALIFTQMTKVLDILEQFLNIHGYRYMRLDGATKIEDRQLLTEKFNRDPKIPVFILSTRSGGLGINLTGADTVIFYDSDWNPAMDKQCQDRCHRIGQSRDVHIYRFVSEYTIESNILRKANQKRQLDNVVIQEGDFTTDYFGKFSVKDLVDDATIVTEASDKPLAAGLNENMANVLAQAEDEDDRTAATEAMKETAIDDEDFNDDAKSATTAAATPSQTPAPESSDQPIFSSQRLETEDMDYDDGVGHIDEYMLRFIANGYYHD